MNSRSPRSALRTARCFRTWVRRIDPLNPRTPGAFWRHLAIRYSLPPLETIRKTDADSRLPNRRLTPRIPGGPPVVRPGIPAHAATERRDRLATLAKTCADVMVLTDSEGLIQDFNPAASALFGLDEDHVAGRTLSEFLAGPDLSAFRRALDDVAQGRAIRALNLDLRAADGTEAPVSVSLSPVRDERGAAHAITWVARDRSDRQRIEGELRRANAELSQLSATVLRAQDAICGRIARELHDSTAQNLAALAMNLSILVGDASMTPRQSKVLEECLHLTEEACRELRSLSYLLHPPKLDEAGLLPALRMYVTGFAQRTGIRTRLRASPGWRRLSTDVEFELFRIVQEALRNIQRHSGSRTARIGLTRARDHVLLEIGDSGRGLPGGLLEGSSASACLGVGIPGMQARARQLSGLLQISSTHRGTTVRVRVPLEL